MQYRKIAKISMVRR